jgi:hypothetical protein
MSSIKKEYWNRTEYINEEGQYHRLDGPAIKWHDGVKQWWVNGKCHRLDGPAIEMPSGTKWWYLNGKEYTKEEWETIVTKIKLKRILKL